MIGYGLHSLCGHYWFRKTGGIPKEDALGTINFDGAGNFSGKFILNTSGVVTPLTYFGTYTVNSDGTGVFTWTRTLPDNSNQTLHSHIVALRAENWIFTELISSLDSPDPASGELSQRLIYRQPNQ